MIDKSLILGEWKYYIPNLQNGHETVNFEKVGFSLEGSILKSDELERMREEQAEIIAISEKCMVLKGRSVIHILLRNP